VASASSRSSLRCTRRHDRLHGAANGDINPYGLANVTTSVGSLKAGDYLISNFNAKSNNRDGTTIVEMTRPESCPCSRRSARRRCPLLPGGVGLTTALRILRGGYVVVGSLPTTNGIRHSAARLPDRAQQQRHAVSTIAARTSRAVGHDLDDERIDHRPCSSATCSTAPRPV